LAFAVYLQLGLVLFWQLSTVEMEQISTEALDILVFALVVLLIADETLVITYDLNKVILEIADHKRCNVVVND
jgi:hypothetical protein